MKNDHFKRHMNDHWQVAFDFGEWMVVQSSTIIKDVEACHVCSELLPFVRRGICNKCRVDTPERVLLMRFMLGGAPINE